MNHIVPRLFILTFMISITGFGSAGHFTIDPIGSHIHGEPFTISGIKPENTSRIGIEVFPLSYWEYACRFGEMSKAKHFRFVLQYLSETLNTAPYVKLVRFNPDKTQSYQEYPPCPDHILSHPFVSSGPGNSRWSTRIGETGQGRYLKPGTYRILVWDGSDQILYSDTYQPNGWDVSGDHIYPATFRGNVWDLENKQECVSRVFSIR